MKYLTNTAEYSYYKKINKKSNYKINDLTDNFKNITIKTVNLINFNQIKKEKQIIQFIQKILHSYQTTSEFNNLMIKLFKLLNLNTNNYIPINLFMECNIFNLDDDINTLDSDTTDSENDIPNINKKHFISYNILANSLNINGIYYKNKRFTPHIINSIIRHIFILN